MKKNMGLADKTIRVLAAIGIIVLYFSGVISGVAAIILGIISIIFLLTSFISFCPLYWPFGINTSGKKSESI